MPKLYSARDVLSALRRAGFTLISQKGSHVKLEKKTHSGKIVTIVPMHKELAPGTLKGILELAKVTEQKFWEKV